MVRVTTKVQCNEMFLLQNYLLGAETHLFLKVLPETDQTKNTSLTKSFSDLPIYWYHHRWTPTMVCFSLVISNQCGQTKNTISSKKKCLFGGQFFLMSAAHTNWYPHLLCEIFPSITWQTRHDCHLPADCPRRSAYTARKAAARRGKSSSLRSPPRRLCWRSRPILLDRAAGHEDVDGGAGTTTVGRWTSFKARQSKEVETWKSKTVKAG